MKMKWKKLLGLVLALTLVLSTGSGVFASSDQDLAGEVAKYDETAFGFFEWVKETRPGEDIEAQGALDILNRYPSTVRRNPDGATSLTNLKKALVWIEEGNNKRAQDEDHPWLRPLMVTHRMMAKGMSNADASYDYKRGHLHHFQVGENLAWGEYSDPYDGWYDSEKAIYDQEAQKYRDLYKEDHPDASQKEVVIGGDALMFDDPDLFAEIGHYLNIVMPNDQVEGMENTVYQITGLGFNAKPTTWSQVFHFGGWEKTFTPSDYRAMVNEYEAFQKDLINQEASLAQKKTFSASLLVQPSYKIDLTDQGQAVFTKGKSKGIAYRLEGSDQNELYSVLVDGKTCQELTDYLVKKGSLIVEFSKEFLEGLAPGRHSVEINSAEGKVSTYFFVQDGVGKLASQAGQEKDQSEVGKDNPPTGNLADPVFWLSFFLISITGLVILKKKSRV